MNPQGGLRRSLLCVACVLLIGLSLAVAAEDNVFQPAGELLAGDGSDDHYFGNALAIDGQTAVVGATGWNNNGNAHQGAVYVFTGEAAGWTERAQILAADGAPQQTFGAAVDVDGDTLAVGMTGKLRPVPNFAVNVGAVYVYTGAGATWTEQAVLMPADLVAMNYLGADVALDGDTLLAGAYTSSGAANESAYVFRRAGTTWTQETKLTAPGEAADREFGWAVALHGDVALVGAPGENCCNPSDMTPGVVYVFTRAGNVWSAAGSFAPDDSENGDNFGCAIDFDGQTAVVAACEAYSMTPVPGKAYVFVRDGANWVQQIKLTPDVAGLNFDIDDVALYGSRLVLGASDAPVVIGNWPGAAFVYERAADAWTHTQTLYGRNAQDGDEFGWQVALSADTLMVGAPSKNVLNQDQQGKVHIFGPAIEAAHTLYLPVAVGRPPAPAPADLIVYVDNVDFELDIFTIRADGTGKTNLTNSPEDEYYPRWSPDRQYIAFNSDTSPSGSELWVMNADGSDQRVIPTPGLHMMQNLAWSPDGTKIAFTAYTGTGHPDWDIYVVGVDGSGLTNLTPDLDGETNDPAWSPDGTKIVFRHYPDSQIDLVVINADGSGAMNLTDDEYYENGPDWSPDGQTILFWGGGPGSGDNGSLLIMPAAGGLSQLLLDSATNGRWSSDGAHIVFTGGGGGIFIANADGSNIVPVDESPGASLADW